MQTSKELLASLSDQWLEATLIEASTQIKREASLRQVPVSTMGLFLRLHASFVPREVAREMLPRDFVKTLANNAAGPIERTALALRDMRRADPGLFAKSLGPSTLRQFRGRLFLEIDGTERQQVYIGPVAGDHGFFIQENLHYIGTARTDTAHHLGLYLGDSKYPSAYCAISPLDREYIHRALKGAAHHAVPAMDKICVMTRSFGYHPMPKNTMSRLYAASARHALDQGYEYMVTALNPYLGFSGSTFLGSSFIPFATSPMQYYFTGRGTYTTRRSATLERLSQRAPTPPIAWLCRGLTKTHQRKLEAIPPDIYGITADEYEGRKMFSVGGVSEIYAAGGAHLE